MKQTGQILKSARETQRVSINEVSMATKISPRMLQAIEAGDVEALPAKTFLRGFVQSYASFLKLNVDELMETFHQEMGTTLPKVNVEAEVPVEERDVKKAPTLLQESKTISRVIAGVAIVVLIFLIVGVKNLIEKYEREADVVPPEGLQGLQANPVEATSAVQAVTATPPAAAPKVEAPKPTESTTLNPSVNDPVVAAPTPTLTPAPVAAEAVTSQPTAVASPAPPVVEKKPEPVVEVKPEAPPAVTPPAPPAPVATETSTASNEIILEALDTVEVQFRIGNGELRKIALKPDQIHTIKAVGPVTLELSDGGAVNVIHNGRDRGVPGDLGKPKKIRIQ